MPIGSTPAPAPEPQGNIDPGTVPKKPASVSPRHAGIILTVLTIGAIVASLNMSIANVALPSIGRELNATQVQLTMVASMYTLGLAATVLYLGAIGDRYGRKLLLVLGAVLSIPTALMSAYAPNIEILILARLLAGIAAGMLYPTTLSLISALWKGAAKTKSIALWSGASGAASAFGAVATGFLLEEFWWGSVFLITVPLAAVVAVAAFLVVPWNAGDRSSGVDNLGGVLSVFAIAGLIYAIQQVPSGISISLVVAAIVSIVAFILLFIHLNKATLPIVDLKLASAPTFWVALVAGTIASGCLIAAMFIGQQYVQNILNYDTLLASAVIIPCSLVMMFTSPLAGRMVEGLGTRKTFIVGLIGIAVGFIIMILTWTEDANIWSILVAFAVLGFGVGFVSTPTSHALMASLPSSRAGMGSAFADLRRDFGGASMQAIMGTILTLVYMSSLNSDATKLTPEQMSEFSTESKDKILSSFESAESAAQSFPQEMQAQIIAAAREAFTEGKTVSSIVSLGLVLLALVLILWKYPKPNDEAKFFATINS